MAQCGKKELLAARNAAGLSRTEVGDEVGVSPETVRRWETPGEANPGPDDVWRLEHLYKRPGLWHQWMQCHYDSYREMYPGDVADCGLALDVVNIRHQLADVMSLQDLVERDVMDGRIDDQRAKDQYLHELNDLQAAITQLMGRLT